MANTKTLPLKRRARMQRVSVAKFGKSNRNSKKKRKTSQRKTKVRKSKRSMRYSRKRKQQTAMMRSSNACMELAKTTNK